MDQLQWPIDEVGHIMKRYGLLEPEEDVNVHISNSLNSIVSMSKVRIWFGTLAGTVSNLFVAVFSITFIAFFFLKDSGLFSGIIMAFVPSHYEEQVKNALDSIPVNTGALSSLLQPMKSERQAIINKYVLNFFILVSGILFNIRVSR